MNVPDDTVLSLYKNKRTRQEIASEVGLSMQEVCKHLCGIALDTYQKKYKKWVKDTKDPKKKPYSIGHYRCVCEVSSGDNGQAG